jgi:hypothetical protein
MLYFTDSVEERNTLYLKVQELQNNILTTNFSVTILTLPEVEEFTPCNTLANSSTLIINMKEIIEFLIQCEKIVIVHINN